jgi:hypothetical protein
MAIADELIALLGFELTGESEARRYEDTLKRLERTAERVGNAIGTGLKIASAAAAAGFALLGRSVVNTNAQFEQYQATLETIEGSADKAKQALGWISEFAKTTPYEVSQITEAFVKLKAYGIDPIANDALRTLGDTASAMGKPLNAAVEMFADASGMEFERLKEFGIRATQAGDNVTFSWTKNGVELTETIKKNATDVRAFLLETLGDRFSGAMDRQSRTFNGMMSNLGDSWTDFQRRIGDSGFFQKVTDELAGLLATIARLDSEGKLDQWAAALGSALSFALDVFVAVATRIAENVNTIIENWETLQPVATALGVALGFLFARAFPLVTIFSLIALAADDLFAYFQGGESVIGNFISWIQKIVPVSNEVAGAIAAMSAAVGVALVAAFTLKPFMVAGIALRLVTGLVTALVPALMIGLTGLSSTLVAGFTAAFALLSNPVGWAIILAGVAAALVAYFWNDLKALWASLDFAWMGQAIGNGILAGLNAVTGAIRAWFESLIPQWAKDFQAGGGVFGNLGITQPGDKSSTPIDEKMRAIYGNYQGNTDVQKSAESAVVNQTDARVISQTNNVTVNQTVSQPSNAPGQAAQATGQAVRGAVANQRSQIETEPHF